MSKIYVFKSTTWTFLFCRVTHDYLAYMLYIKVKCGPLGYMSDNPALIYAEASAQKGTQTQHS